MTEGSAGSTAISLATVAPAFGCRCHVVIPDDAAIEKVFFFFQYIFYHKLIHEHDDLYMCIYRYIQHTILVKM